MHPLTSAIVLLCLACCFARATAAADDNAAPKPTLAIQSMTVALPSLLREVAGNGKLSPVTHTLIDVAYPPGFDAARAWPILVISATSDPGFNSSRDLMRRYAETATAAGWVVIAADAQGEVAQADDNFKLRLALVSAALAAVQLQWPGAAEAPLAFGGFSGGAKHSGWLAAAFVAQQRKVIGVFQAGINQESFAKSGKQLKVLDADFLKIPVFLLGGSTDRIATPDAHRSVQRQLKRAGFNNVQLDFIDNAHRVDPQPLQRALDWFAKLAAKT